MRHISHRSRPRIVHVGSHAAKTGTNGKATLTVPGQRRSTTLKPSASAANYLSAATALRVTVKKH